jgi:hypothetical protein
VKVYLLHIFLRPVKREDKENLSCSFIGIVNLKPIWTRNKNKKLLSIHSLAIRNLSTAAAFLFHSKICAGRKIVFRIVCEALYIKCVRCSYGSHY